MELKSKKQYLVPKFSTKPPPPIKKQKHFGKFPKCFQLYRTNKTFYKSVFYKNLFTFGCGFAGYFTKYYYISNSVTAKSVGAVDVTSDFAGSE